MNIGERIKYLRTELLHLTGEEFGNALGVGRSAISNIEKGERGTTPQMCKSICREFHVNEEWLTSGEGEPFTKRTKNQEIADFLNNVMNDDDEAFKKRFAIALSRMTPEGWEMVEKFCEEICRGKE